MTDTFKFGGIEFKLQWPDQSLHNPIMGSIDFFMSLAREHGLDDKCSKTWPDNWIITVPFRDDYYYMIAANQMEWK